MFKIQSYTEINCEFEFKLEFRGLGAIGTAMIYIGVIVGIFIIGVAIILWYKSYWKYKSCKKTAPLADSDGTEFTSMPVADDDEQMSVPSDPVMMDLNNGIVTIMATPDGNFEYVYSDPSAPVEENQENDNEPGLQEVAETEGH